MLAFCVALRPGSCSLGASDLPVQFANPPSDTRILKIIHTWPDAANDQERLIRGLTNQGFGGVVCNVSFEDYLESASRWTTFSEAVQRAKDAGMALWLYDEKGYPSANAGGLVMRDHPEWQAQGLLIADTETNGGPVAMDVPPGKLVLAAAFPMADGVMELHKARPLADAIAGGKLSWQPPSGQWHVIIMTEEKLFDGTHAAMNLHEKMPYPNLLLPEVTQRFLEVTHAEYARRLGADLGRFFESTFTDEPSLMSCFLRPMPYRVLPWAQNLPGEFQRRRGYELQPILPLLVGEAGPGSQKARYDFWLTIGELVSENFFGQIQAWCARHNIPSGGHLLAEESMVTHVPFYGDFFRCIRRMDAPSIDMLTSFPAEVPWHIARLLASAAELEGKTLVMSETSDHSQRYRAPDDKRPVQTVTEDDIRGTCNRLFVNGVNTITSYYSFAGLSDAQLRRLNEWVGRCCLMLRGGHQTADIAVLYPVESIWPRFVPSRHWANEAAAAARIENAYRSVSESLFAAQREFTYVDARALAEAKATGGQLVHGQLRWRVVVLPHADTLPLAAWENLAAFMKQGGVVVAAGALPRNSEREFPSPRVQALAKEIFGGVTNKPNVLAIRDGGAGVFLPEGSESLLIGILNQCIERDFATDERRAPLRVTHRRTAGHELYFVINDRPDPWQGNVRFRANGSGERWDPASGRRESVGASERHVVKLEGYGAAVFRFAEARSPKVTQLRSGSLPGITLEGLPLPSVQVSAGEFVRRELLTNAPDAAVGREWRAVGTITKSGVDTFLFVRLEYPAGIDLAGSDSLLIETVVPDGQRTSTQLLVILHENDGSDYLAHTGRSLAAAGSNQTFVPISRFQLAGWSKDENAQLDLNRIAEIRVGWGGYFGKDGERVEFRLRLPSMGRESW